jgi:hypothetical protein
MKYLKFIFLGLGFVLLGVILRQTNLQEVWQQITLVGWWGMTLVIIFYFLKIPHRCFYLATNF